MTIRRRSHAAHVIPTASMADIAMLLLIFFLSTTFIRSREAMEIQLPGAFAGERARAEQTVRIWLGPAGEVALNDARVARADLPRLLAAKLARNPSLLVVVHADARAPYAELATIIDALKQARSPSVLLATRRAAR